MIESKTVRVQGLEVDVITLSNEVSKAVLTNLGARLVELHVPDKAGRLADIVLQRSSFDSTDSYDLCAQWPSGLTAKDN